MRFYDTTLAQDADAIVVAFDLCSSSNIMEQLISRSAIEKYAEMIGKIKEHLAKRQVRKLFVLYKFTGDGWILLFPITNDVGADVLAFMHDLSGWFKGTFKKIVDPYLDTALPTRGLTFGVDVGRMHRMKIYQRDEYVGRAINVACRLQSAVKENDKAPGYKALVSKAVYENHFTGIPGYVFKRTTRVLRNISANKPVSCRKVRLA